MRARFFLLGLILSLSALCLVVPVYAQTISISNLQHPSRIVVNKQLTVSFTISYSGASSKDYLATGIYIPQQSSFAKGNIVSSSPQTCQEDPTAPYDAFCLFQPSGNQGSENIVFALSDASTGTFSFSAVAMLGYSSTTCSVTFNLCVDAYSGNQPFSVSVIDKFTLTVSTPSQVSVTVDGVQEHAGFTSLQLSPSLHTMSVPAMVQVDNSTRLRFDHWEDGSTDTTRTLNLQDDTTVTADYTTQYRLTLISGQGIATGSDWYDSGTVASFSVPSRVEVIWVFQGWYEGPSLVTSSSTGSITLNAPHTLVARWGLDYIIMAGIIGVIVGIAVGLAYFGKKLPFLAKPSRKRARRKQAKRTQAVSEPVIADAAVSKTTAQEAVKPSADEKAAMFCTQCGAKILRDSKFCKECGAKLQ